MMPQNCMFQASVDLKAFWTLARPCTAVYIIITITSSRLHVAPGIKNERINIARIMPPYSSSYFLPFLLSFVGFSCGLAFSDLAFWKGWIKRSQSDMDSCSCFMAFGTSAAWQGTWL